MELRMLARWRSSRKRLGHAGRREFARDGSTEVVEISLSGDPKEEVARAARDYEQRRGEYPYTRVHLVTVDDWRTLNANPIFQRMVQTFATRGFVDQRWIAQFCGADDCSVTECVRELMPTRRHDGVSFQRVDNRGFRPSRR